LINQGIGQYADRHAAQSNKASRPQRAASTRADAKSAAALSSATRVPGGGFA
jgi:hypothetical protein